MKIFRVVATIEDGCGENRYIDFIKDSVTIERALSYVMDWANFRLKPGHNHLVKDSDDHYTIWANQETGPDYIYSCWIEEDVLDGYDTIKQQPINPKRKKITSPTTPSFNLKNYNRIEDKTE